MDYAPITASSECTTCHAGEIVTGIHGGTCTVCHTSTIPGLLSSPNLSQFAGTTTACIDCHQTSNDAGFTTPFHGISSANSTTQTRHNNLAGSDSSGGYDCASCHTDMADAQAKLIKHMATDTVSNCYRCHFPSTWGAVVDEPSQSVIAAVKGAGTAQNC